LAIRAALPINGLGVIETMADAMMLHGVPEHIRSDNGPDMTATPVRNRLAGVDATSSRGLFVGEWLLRILQPQAA
jgi:putative transposase